MKRVDSKTVYEGPRLAVIQERWRHPDGSESDRELADVEDAVTVIAHDDEFVYMVRQPREAVEEPALLELPAGKLDVEGESGLECARRELVEEIGRSAREWRELKRFYPTPGLAREAMTLFLATGLEEVECHRPDPEERIEVVPWPLTDLDRAIADCEDAKSLIGLYVLRDLLRP